MNDRADPAEPVRASPSSAGRLAAVVVFANTLLFAMGMLLEASAGYWEAILTVSGFLLVLLALSVGFCVALLMLGFADSTVNRLLLGALGLFLLTPAIASYWKNEWSPFSLTSNSWAFLTGAAALFTVTISRRVHAELSRTHR